MALVIQPRVIRYRDAPSYCGVGRRVFDRDIRPWLIVIRVGKVGIAFDRLDLDAWIEQHKSCSGRPPEKGDSWTLKNVGNHLRRAWKQDCQQGLPGPANLPPPRRRQSER